MSNQRVLITGANGFSGSRLALLLRRSTPTRTFGLDRGGIPNEHVHSSLRCDITDGAAVCEAVAEARPDLVFHLAGLFGSASDEQIWATNVDGFAWLCQALRRQAHVDSRRIRMLTLGSAAELGSHGVAELPVREDAECRPERAYGQSKLEATRRALAEPVDGPLQMIVARPFNLLGPGMASDQALGSFARQAAAVLRGESAAIYCGNLEARRDFVDVDDAVRAYVALARRGRPGQLYNVCGGRSYRIGDLLQKMIAMTQRAIPVCIDAARRQDNDLADVYGDNTKIRDQLGWQPVIPIEQSLAALMAALGEKPHRNAA